MQDRIFEKSRLNGEQAINLTCGELLFSYTIATKIQYTIVANKLI